jgi:hypothetical protein
MIAQANGGRSWASDDRRILGSAAFKLTENVTTNTGDCEGVSQVS